MVEQVERKEEEPVVEQVGQKDFVVEERWRLLDAAVVHYHIPSRGVTSPVDFLNRVKMTVIRLFRERPRTNSR